MPARTTYFTRSQPTQYPHPTKSARALPFFHVLDVILNGRLDLVAVQHTLGETSDGAQDVCRAALNVSPLGLRQLRLEAAVPETGSAQCQSSVRV